MLRDMKKGDGKTGKMCIRDRIYSWTYSDEQRAKAAWQGENNPYAALPRMVLLTYRMPEAVSYTHLDVYKRQMYARSAYEANTPQLFLNIDREKAQSMHCLLYTSRCV